MAYSKTVKKIYKKMSATNIDVDAARKIAELKSYTMAHIFSYQMDLHINRKGYKIPIRIFFPNKEIMESFVNNQSKTPIIVYIHGGGWVTDNPLNYQRISVKMAKELKSILISIDYRLAPEYKFPIGLEDCYYVMKKICMNQFPYKTRGNKITIMGDSAGGNLATVVAMMARDRKEFTINAQILIYPVTNSDYTTTSPYESVHTNGFDYVLTAGKMRDFVSLYERTSEDRNNPYFTPVIAKDLTNMPKTLILTAQYDPLRDEGEDYGKKLRSAGNKVKIYRIKNVIHGYFGVGINPVKIKETLDIIKKFLKHI